MANGKRARRRAHRDGSGCSMCRPKQVTIRMAAARELKKLKAIYDRSRGEYGE